MEIYHIKYENVDLSSENLKPLIESYKTQLGYTKSFFENNTTFLINTQDSLLRIGIIAKIVLEKNDKNVGETTNFFFHENDAEPKFRTGVFSQVTSHAPNKDFVPFNKGYLLDCIGTNTFPQKMILDKNFEENKLVYDIPCSIMDRSEEISDSESDGETKKTITKIENKNVTQEIYIEKQSLTIKKNGYTLLENFDLNRFLKTD